MYLLLADTMHSIFFFLLNIGLQKKKFHKHTYLQKAESTSLASERMF